MATVSYPYEMPYHDMGRGNVPVLQMGVQAVTAVTEAIDVDAYLDSGALYSLFDGAILAAIGLNILDGPLRLYYPVAGQPIEARVLPVRLVHEQLGNFELEIGFSMGVISRNLLGRDFFNRVQIGFRERQLRFLINPTP